MRQVALGTANVGDLAGEFGLLAETQPLEGFARGRLALHQLRHHLLQA